MKTTLPCLAVMVVIRAMSWAADGIPDPGTGDTSDLDWKSFFPFAKTAEPLPGLKPHERAFVVKDADDKIQGWVFRTDQVDPQIRGHVSQVPALVGLSTEGYVMGIQVLPNKEVPSYFQKLGEVFAKQFENHAADNSLTKLDTVTGATHSSAGIVKDVAAAVKAVMKLPAVQSALTTPTDPSAPHTK